MKIFINEQSLSVMSLFFCCLFNSANGQILFQDKLPRGGPVGTTVVFNGSGIDVSKSYTILTGIRFSTGFCKIVA